MGRKATEQVCYISAFLAETTLGTLVVVDGAKYSILTDHEVIVPDGSGDVRVNNRAEVNGSEQPTTSEIPETRISIPYSKPRVFSFDLACMGKLFFGNDTITKDGANTAYRHYLKPEAIGTELPSMSMILVDGADQKQYTGLKGGNFSLKGEQGGHWSLATELMGTGARADNASSLSGISRVTELTMKMADTKVYIKTSPNPATDIIAAGSQSQATDNISSAQNLTSIGSRVRSISFDFDNAMNPIAGAGGGGTLLGIDFGQRTYKATVVLDYVDQTELDYYENQTNLAFEVNCKSSTAIDTGNYYYGFILRIPLCRVASYVKTEGGPGDPEQTVTLELEIFDDGTNPFVDMTCYNAQAAFGA